MSHCCLSCHTHKDRLQGNYLCPHGYGYNHLFEEEPVIKVKQTARIDPLLCTLCGLHQKNPKSKSSSCAHVYLQDESLHETILTKTLLIDVKPPAAPAIIKTEHVELMEAPSVPVMRDVKWTSWGLDGSIYKTKDELVEAPSVPKREANTGSSITCKYCQVTKVRTLITSTSIPHFYCEERGCNRWTFLSPNESEAPSIPVTLAIASSVVLQCRKCKGTNLGEPVKHCSDRKEQKWVNLYMCKICEIESAY